MNPKTTASAPHRSARFFPRAALVVLIAAAIWTRFWGLSWGFPNTYHVDEVAFAERAAGMLMGDLNPHIFDVPTLHTYAIAGLWKIYYWIGHSQGRFDSMAAFLDAMRTDATVFFLIGRALSALLGAATVLLVFFIGKRLYGRRIGALAAVLFLVASDHVKMSHDMTPDVTMVFFIVLSFYFVVRIFESGRTRDYLAAGFFAGMAMAAKYGGHMLAIPIVLAHVFNLRDRGRPIREIILSPRLIGAGLAFGAAFVLGCPYAVLDFSTFAKGFLWQSSHLAKTGHFGSSMAQPALLFYLQYGFRESIGVWTQFLVYGGIIRAFWLRRRKDILVLAFPITLIVMVGLWATRATRYILSASPLFALGGAVFLDRAAVFVSGILRRGRPEGDSRFRTETTAWVLAAVLVLPSAARIVRFDLTIAQPDTRAIAKEWIHRNIPKGAKIAFENYGPPFSRTVYATVYRHALGQIDMEWLAKQKVQYVVISDITYARFTRFPADFPREAAFYRDLEREAVLLKTIAPRHDEDMLDLHNPTLKIYKLSQSAHYGFPGNFSDCAVNFRIEALPSGRWMIEAAWRTGPEVPVDERAGERYLRIVDGRERTIVRLAFPSSNDREVDSPPARTEFEALPDDARLFLGYDFTWAPNLQAEPPESTLTKEFLFPERIDPARARRRPFLGQFWYAGLPGKQGPAYFQIVTLARRGEGASLISRIFGSSLRYADYRILNPSLRLLDGDGRDLGSWTLWTGLLGSEGGDRPSPWETRKTLPGGPWPAQIALGYEDFCPIDPSLPRGGPASVILRIPSLDKSPDR